MRTDGNKKGNETGGKYIALMMEAASTSETLVSFQETTYCNAPEGCHVHTHCHENLKPHILLSGLTPYIN
jgi:hypothetical protein